MTRVEELLPTVQQGLPPADIKGRRRPGRIDQLSPHLIPLLRDPSTADIPALLPGKVDLPPLQDDLVPVKGILFSLALSIPLWASIAMIVRAVLR